MGSSRYASFWNLYLARLREFYRQPARIFWVYGFPLILAIGLGLAFRSRPIETMAVDLVETPYSSEIAEALAEAPDPDQPAVQILVKTFSKEQALQRIQTGKATVMIEPIGPRQVRYHYDPTRPESLTTKALADDRIQRGMGRSDRVETGETLVTEPGSRYIDFLIPGLIGLNVMGGGLWGIGFLVVNFRISKLLKRFVATPMPRQNFLLAILAARMTFLGPDLLILLSLGVFGFGVPIRGSFLLLLLVVILGALAFAGIGLLVACRTDTTETVSGLMNLVMIPMWLLSGVFFSYDNFPEIVHPLIQLLPLTQLLDALRRIMLEGAGLLEIWPALAILASYAGITFAVALRLFKWT